MYSRVPDPAALVPLFESYLDDYNATSTAPMKLVMFLDAIEHMSRLCRQVQRVTVARPGAGSTPRLVHGAGWLRGAAGLVRPCVRRAPSRFQTGQHVAARLPRVARRNHQL